jgi:hypothetical protein
MNLLGAILYDPSTAATKACTANIAMTAFDDKLKRQCRPGADSFVEWRVNSMVDDLPQAAWRHERRGAGRSGDADT